MMIIAPAIYAICANIAYTAGPIFDSLFYICANIAYTAGPIFDSLFYLGGPRKQLFKAGYIFSVALTALPGGLAVVVWISTLVTGKKLD